MFHLQKASSLKLISYFHCIVGFLFEDDLRHPESLEQKEKRMSLHLQPALDEASPLQEVSGLPPCVVVANCSDP